MRICLAALFSSWVRYIQESGQNVRNGFTTFYQYRIKEPGVYLNYVVPTRKIVDELLICDSGAHSFFAENPSAGASASGHRKETKTTMGVDEYWARYLTFMHIAAPYIDYFVELDIGEIVGQDQVMRWREQARSEGLLHKLITVFHPKVMTWDDYRRMCETSESRYVAVEGDRPLQRKGRLDYTRAIKVARESRCRVHGFAMTKIDALGTYPFYSVDSTSWQAPFRFGQSIAIQKPRQLADIDQRRVQHAAARKIIVAQELRAWKEREDYYTQLWTKRGVTWWE